VFSLDSNPVPLALFPVILNNQLMHQHYPVDCVVRDLITVVNHDDFFKNYRLGLVAIVCIKDDLFELCTHRFILSSWIRQLRDNSFILVLSFQLVDPSFVTHSNRAISSESVPFSTLLRIHRIFLPIIFPLRVIGSFGKLFQDRTVNST